MEDAVRSIDWPHKQDRFTFHGQSFPSTTLMALEVYCYARGVYSSEDVEESIRPDPYLRELFAEEWPAPDLIRRFRRDHREPIKQCLFYVFDHAFQARFGEPSTDTAPVDHCVALALDRWFEPMCGPRPEAEAEERLEKAIFWDGMAGT